MHSDETRAVKRAVLILFLVSAARWGWSQRGVPAGTPEATVLPELLEGTREAAQEGARRNEPLEEGETLDPNRASEVELDRLPGVGPSTARAIVAAREPHFAHAARADLRLDAIRAELRAGLQSRRRACRGFEEARTLGLRFRRKQRHQHRMQMRLRLRDADEHALALFGWLLEKIVEVHYPGIGKDLVSRALELFFQLREVPGLKKKPSTSELIDWLKLLLADQIPASALLERDPTKAIPPLYGALVKNEQDVQLLERLAFMHRRQSAGR